MTDDKRMTRADAADRAERAWRLRVARHSWAEVAQLTGYSDPANAVRAVKNYFHTLPVISSEDLRAMWRERHELLWAQAQQDAEAGRAGAVRAGVAVARSAAQLDGLDAPTRVVVTPDATRFEEVVQRMTAAVRGEEDTAQELDLVVYGEIEDEDWGDDPDDLDDEAPTTD